MARHVVINLHLVIDEFGAKDITIAQDYTREGERMLGTIAGSHKHVEVEVHNLDEKEETHGPTGFGAITRVPPPEIDFRMQERLAESWPQRLTDEQVAELLGHKRCGCGTVHLKAGDVT